VGALEAIDRLPLKRQVGRDNLVGEADSKGFLDNIAPGGVGRRLEEHLDDGAWWRLLKTWRKAGGLDTDGPVLPPATGPPQGGRRSPLLANVDVH
jgi:hypothetical protein